MSSRPHCLTKALHSVTYRSLQAGQPFWYLSLATVFLSQQQPNFVTLQSTGGPSAPVSHLKDMSISWINIYICNELSSLCWVFTRLRIKNHFFRCILYFPTENNSTFCIYIDSASSFVFFVFSPSRGIAENTQSTIGNLIPFIQ